MKKVRVKEINGYDYVLEDIDNTYTLNIEFYDVEVHIGDYIYISDKILNEKNVFAFGPINKVSKDEDIIKLIHNNNEIYLQRYYG